MLTFQLLMAASTSFSPIWREDSSLGSTCTRTAYLAEPKTRTWATPDTIEMRCASMVSAYSSKSERRTVLVGEVMKTVMMGWSPGLTLRKEGGVDRKSTRLNSSHL